MEATIEKSADKVQLSKSIINNRVHEFIKFVVRCLDDDDFVDTMNKLLPFDKCIQSKMKIEDDASIVRNMAISIMRMEIEPPRFSLGVSLDFAVSVCDEVTNSTTFIAACKTIEELKTYVQNEDFMRSAVESFEKQIDAIGV